MLVDGEDLTRTGISAALHREPDIRVVAETDSSTEVLSLTGEHEPDIVIMDVRLPGVDGIETTRLLTQGGRASIPRVVILTSLDLDDCLMRALRAGASGFLLKNTSTQDLVRAIRVVAEGDAVICPPMTRRLIDRFDIVSSDAPDARLQILRILTVRELEVLKEIAKGRSNKEIARELDLTLATVKCHVSNVLAKLRLRDRVQVALFAQEVGLVKTSSQLSFELTEACRTA